MTQLVSSGKAIHYAWTKSLSHLDNNLFLRNRGHWKLSHSACAMWDHGLSWSYLNSLEVVPASNKCETSSRDTAHTCIGRNELRLGRTGKWMGRLAGGPMSMQGRDNWYWWQAGRCTWDVYSASQFNLWLIIVQWDLMRMTLLATPQSVPQLVQLTT